MTDWTLFFQILCRHRQGFGMTLPYATAVDHPSDSDVAKCLYMVPLPEGHPTGISALASEWITAGDVECRSIRR